ncbi:MAG: hypothetical protein JSU58_08785 [Dehalococcoidales bacterium]|nr:MAG: hypothetical protein JSU58_08785 [Dehalococcoidales bacterium]
MRTVIQVIRQCVTLLIMILLLVSLSSCYRIVRSEEISQDDDTPVIATGILSAYGGASALWLKEETLPGFGPNLAKLQIPPGSPTSLHAYVALENAISTVSDIEKIEVKYFILPHSTCEYSPYIRICLDLDNEGKGCDDLIIGVRTSGVLKGRWNILTHTDWQIVSRGYEESYTLDEVQNILGDEPVLQIQVLIDAQFGDKNIVVYIDDLTINDIEYNLEPVGTKPQGNQPFSNH